MNGLTISFLQVKVIWIFLLSYIQIMASEIIIFF